MVGGFSSLALNTQMGLPTWQSHLTNRMYENQQPRLIEPFTEK